DVSPTQRDVSPTQRDVSPTQRDVSPTRLYEETSGADTIAPIAGVRKIIFERMGASAREIARVTLTTEADATRLVELREEINSQQSEMRFSFTDFLVLLTARALLQYPYMNATLREDGVHQHAFVNMGVAADTERGLLVPVVRDAQRKSLGEIYAELRRLSEGARTGKISPDDLRGGTFTITNLGQHEIDAFTPIVNQPETAILGVGRIAQKPAAYQGQLALRWMVSLSLSFDHRIVDGAPAARFLQHVKRLVTSPGLVLV
ncbi:MAG TPA: dihydrolipoamide acetyltransferase family protein, partial [Anaerolineae bacterium]|nr:dihydrolipoamide acetyltransferase family protein [Anaerolineae bacterium]